MLVYEKWVTESNEQVRHLYGTVENTPSDSDNQLVYQDADGDAVTPTLAYTYLDDGHGGIKMVDSEGTETFLAVNIKKSDNSLVNIIPGGNYEPADKVLKSISFKKKPALTYTEGDTIDISAAKVQATFESGEKEDVTSDVVWTPTTSTQLATTDTTITASYTYPAEGADQVTKTASVTITVNAASNDSQPEG